MAQHDRSSFIGGSDAASVMGIGRRTPVEVWLEKTGRAERAAPDARLQRIFARGHRLEPFILEMVVDKLQCAGFRVEVLATNRRFSDPEHPFLSCEIDFELALDGYTEINGAPVVFAGEVVNGDAKSVTGAARRAWGDPDSEAVPIAYAAQFMHGLMVAPGWRRYCIVAALRSFDDVDIYWTVRDDETIAAMRAKLVRFWVDHVLADVTPDPIEFADVRALFPVDNGQPIEATDAIAEQAEALLAISHQMRNLDVKAEALKLSIADYMRPHDRLTHKGRDLLTWRGQGTRTFRFVRQKGIR